MNTQQLEKILLLDKEGKISQERVDFLLDKHIEQVVFGFLTHYGASKMYRKNIQQIDAGFKISFADEIADYLELKEKIYKALKRYEPYLSVEDKENMEIFKKYQENNLKSIEELNFDFRLCISSKIFLNKELNHGLATKEYGNLIKI